MGEDPAAIRAEIDDTKARMESTADALAYKTDVPARTKDKITGVKDSVVGRVTSVKDSVVGTASDRTPSAGEVKDNARQVVGMAQENPLGLALGAAALGLLAGLLVPASRVEDERLGPLADEVKDHAKDIAGEAASRGQQVASEAAQAAKDTATSRGQEHAEELRDSAQGHAAGLRDSAREHADDLRGD